MTIERTIEGLRAGLDACTSGPWSVDNHIVTPGDIGEAWAVFETYEDDPPIVMCVEWQQEANARHIARCSPDNIRALLSEIERLREALKPFAGDKLPSSRKVKIAYNWWGLRCLMSDLEIARLAASRALTTPARTRATNDTCE